MSPFQNKSKSGNKRETLYFLKYVKGVFVFIKRNNCFFYHVVCFFSMQKDKNRKRVIKLIRVFKKKKEKQRKNRY